MKKIFYITLIFILAFAGCEKILDKEPLQIVSDADVWDDPGLIKSYHASLYDRAPTKRLFIQGYWWGAEWDAWSWPNNDNHPEIHVDPNDYPVLCDEARGGYSWAYSLDLNEVGFNNTTWQLQYWDYQIIRSCNEFLELIQEGNVDEDTRKILSAEVRWIRAFVYLEKVKRYGGVPIISKVQSITDPDEELFPVRNKEQEVYDFVISECELAAEDLPEVASELGHADKYTALATISRAALYAGSIAKYGQVKLNGIVGIPSSEADKYWQIAYDASKEIIDNGPYLLYDEESDKALNYQNIFLDEENSEIIFSRRFIGKDYGHSFDFYNKPLSFRVGWGGFINPTLDLVDDFDFIDGSDGAIDWTSQTSSVMELLKNKDPRLHGSIYYQGSEIEGDSIEAYILEADGVYLENNPGGFYMWDNNGTTIPIGHVGDDVYPIHRDGTKTGFNIKKFLRPDFDQDGQGVSDTDWIEFRLAEILLNYAEAAFELGKPGDARNAVNQIRDRAGIAQRGSITLDQIRHERKIELVFECHRIWDIRRWRIANDVYNKEFHGLNTIWVLPENTYRYEIFNCDYRDQKSNPLPRYFNPQRMYYIAITVDRINNNPNLVENPGY